VTVTMRRAGRTLGMAVAGVNLLGEVGGVR
jgi:hypothetical protein